MTAIVGLVAFFLLTLIILTSLKGATFLDDPDPQNRDRDERQALLTELCDMEMRQSKNIISTANSEYLKHRSTHELPE
jgi:hypothetical protein